MTGLRKSSLAKAQAMADRYAAGLSFKEVAAEFGCSRQSVHSLLQRLTGFEPRPDSKALHLNSDVVKYGGQKWVLSPADNCYRCTTGNRGTLSRKIWIDNNGPIDPGDEVHCHKMGSTDIADYFLFTKADRVQRLIELSRNSRFLAFPEGVTRNWKKLRGRSLFIKFQGRWMSEARAKYLIEHGTIEKDKVVFQGKAMDRDEMTAILRNELPEELQEVGCLIMKIQKTIKQRKNNGKNKNQ